MGFINQFPYSDFHEMNLDWLINQTKLLKEQVSVLQEEIAKIETVTREQVELMIKNAIDTNNIILYNRLIALKSEITSEYKSYVNNQIDQLTTYIDNQDTSYFDLSKTYSDNILIQSKDYTDSKVLDYTMMINPITGAYDDVRDVVDDIVSYFHTDGSLTAGEYDALDLTAGTYDAYEISAYDYDFNGKNIL